MKKKSSCILSICLSIILVLGLVPTAIATATNTATVATTGTTKIEAEDYPTAYVNNNGTITSYDATVKDNVDTASGGKYLFNNKGGSVTDAEHYWEIDLVISQAGTYEFAFSVPTLSRYRFHSVKVMVGDNELYSETNSWPSYNSATTKFGEKTKEQYLEEGTYAFRFYAGKGTGGNQMLNFDYVSVTPVALDSASTSIHIEAEEHLDCVTAKKAGVDFTGGVESREDTSASGGKYLYSQVSGTNTTDKINYWEYDFVIKQAGTYKIKTRVGKPWKYRFGSLKVTFGEITMVNSTSQTTGDAVEWGEYENDITLTAGTYTFKVKTGIGTGGNHHLYVDYVSLECVSLDTGEGEENVNPLKFEYEEYVNENAEIYAIQGASGGRVVSGYTKTEHNYQIPVTIEESRYYDISYVVGKKKDNYSHSEINFSLNLESDFPLPISNTIPEVKVLDYAAKENQVLCLYEYKGIWIDKDDYILETSIEKTYDSYLKYELDYFEISPSEPPEIVQSSVSKIELETYAGVGVYDWDRGVTESADTSGGKVVFDGWSDIDPSWSFPVKVKDSGFYHINYVAGDCYAAWFSKITFKLGKVTLGTNDKDYIEDYGNIIWSSQPLCKYRTEWVWLDEGEYELSVVIAPELIDDVYKYQVDYIEFVPAVNGISMENGVVKVHAAYTDVTSGKVLMALYNGSKLVGTTSYDLSDETYVDFEYVPDETVTKVKVFIWDEENLAKPKELSKNFDLTEN